MTNEPDLQPAVAAEFLAIADLLASASDASGPVSHEGLFNFLLTHLI